MIRKPFIAWLSSLACMLFAGCGGVSVSVLYVHGFPQDQVHPLAFQEVLPVLDSAIRENRLVVVRDLVAWDILWREHTAGLLPPPPLPPINFAQNMVIGVFAGTRVNPCTHVEIQAIWQHTHPERIEVNYREISHLPDPNGQCAQAPRHPAALVALAHSFLPVEFIQIN